MGIARFPPPELLDRFLLDEGVYGQAFDMALVTDARNMMRRSQNGRYVDEEENESKEERQREGRAEHGGGRKGEGKLHTRPIVITPLKLITPEDQSFRCHGC